MKSQELIAQEVKKLIETVKTSLSDMKRIALSEAWKILQLAISSVIQIIEAIGKDLSSPDKKKLAMDLLSEFYDKVFLVVDVPVVPNFLEPVIHKYVKAFLMLLVSSTIDSMVTVFRNTGVFEPKRPSVEV
jgi:hypothetical protein